MGLFYERMETEEKVVIKYKSKILILYYFFIVFALVATFALNVIGGLACIVGPVLLVVLGVGLVVYWQDIWKVRSEISKAMKEGKVSVSGSRFSLSNPLTVEIPKKGKSK